MRMKDTRLKDTKVKDSKTVKDREIKRDLKDTKEVRVTKELPKELPKELVKELRAPSLEFKVADKVVYPAHGVGVIDSIEIRKIGPAEQKFYRILFPEAGMKIMVSVSQVKNVGLRKVVDHKTVEQVYGILRDRNVVVDTQTWNRRFRDYSQKIKTGSVLEIAKVIRDLSALKSDKELSFGERRMLDTAQGLLVKEISIAKAKSEEVIRAELQSICAVHTI